VAPYEGNIYSVMASGSYALNQKTDLTASYSFLNRRFLPGQLRGRFAPRNPVSTAGVQIGIKRRIGKGKTLSLQYSFFHYDEPSSGGFNNFNAQAIFAILSFPLALNGGPTLPVTARRRRDWIFHSSRGMPTRRSAGFETGAPGSQM